MTQATLYFTTRCVLFVTFATTGLFSVGLTVNAQARAIAVVEAYELTEVCIALESVQEVVDVDVIEEAEEPSWSPFYNCSESGIKLTACTDVLTVTKSTRKSDILTHLGTVILLT